MHAHDFTVPQSDAAIWPDIAAMKASEVVALRVRASLLRRLAWLQTLWGGPVPPPGWSSTLFTGDDPAAETRRLAALFGAGA